ncbi:MAG: circularly permuted type 2 ATP-grasp protein, partial [Cyanobacteria bacterium J06633_2]
MQLHQYDPGQFYDELFEAQGVPRAASSLLLSRLENLSIEELSRRQQTARNSLFKVGATFNVYSDNQGTERILPFDIIPRVVSQAEWEQLEKGLKQRIHALNLFLDDIYNEQKIIRDGVIPEHVIRSSKGFLPACVGLKPPKGLWCHITGTDIVRDRDGEWYVL